MEIKTIFNDIEIINKLPVEIWKLLFNLMNKSTLELLYNTFPLFLYFIPIQIKMDPEIRKYNCTLYDIFKLNTNIDSTLKSNNYYTAYYDFHLYFSISDEIKIYSCIDINFFEYYIKKYLSTHTILYFNNEGFLRLYISNKNYPIKTITYKNNSMFNYIYLPINFYRNINFNNFLYTYVNNS